MLTYQAFGLGLSVNAAIPRLDGAPAAGHVDVRIRLQERPAALSAGAPRSPWHTSQGRDEAGRPVLTVSNCPGGGAHWVYSNGVEFVVSPDGADVWVNWPAIFTVDDMSSYLLGPVMGFLLRLRGRVALHGGAIMADDRAIGIVGPSGAGKSTTVGAFLARGHAVLSDDILPLGERRGRFLAEPGYPRVRLRPEAARALSAINPAIPRLPADHGDRRYHLDLTQVSAGFAGRPAPLAALYVLGARSGRPEAPIVNPLSGRAGLMSLIANSFASALLDRPMRERDLDVLSRLAAQVPIRSVVAHEDSSRLEALCEAILDDLSRIPEPVSAI